MYPNTARLFNHLILSCNEEFTWTSLIVQYNLCSPPHRDPTITGDVMVLQLTYNEGGEVWVEEQGGSHFMDIPNRVTLVGGTVYSLHGQALQFPAHAHLQATMPWTAFDRVCPHCLHGAGLGQICARNEVESTLQRLGFCLPRSTGAHPSPILPPVLR